MKIKKSNKGLHQTKHNDCAVRVQRRISSPKQSIWTNEEKLCLVFHCDPFESERARERKKRGKDVRKKRALPNNELHCEKCLNFFIISLFFFNILHTMFKCFRRVHLYRMRTNLYWSYCTVEHDERDRVKSTSVIPIVARYLFGAKIRLFESIWYGHCWQWFIGKTGK